MNTARLSDHPFSPENIARESGANTKSQRAWTKFVAECERLLGHDLDGNDPDAFDRTKTGGDGYSLDEAHDMFSAGKTAHAYVAMVASRERYKGGAEVRNLVGDDGSVTRVIKPA